MPSADLALHLTGISKTFSGVRALTDVDLAIRPGSIHALLGRNGSGKSTLIKCLAGVYSPDPGAVGTVFGQRLALGDARDAHRKGLRFVHQDLGIIPELNAADNIGLATGFERGGMRRIDWRRQARAANELLERFGFTLDPFRPMAAASPTERSAVAIVRAVADWQGGHGVLALDEPTAALAAHEVDRLFSLIRDIAATGSAVILVSHRLDEVTAIADRATVLRDGKRALDVEIAHVSLGQLVDAVVGAADGQTQAGPTSSHRRPPVCATGRQSPVLEVRDLRGRHLHGVNFTVAAGEIVGIAGLLGSGREELPYVLAGDQVDGITGRLIVDGVPATYRSVPAARRLGIVLVPEDRATEGILDGFSTLENMSLGGLRQIRRAGFIRPTAERRFAEHWMTAVLADPTLIDRPISVLSGGNQQKVVFGRSLSSLPKLLVLSEPTAGIDVAARQAIYSELRNRAELGLAVVIASSDIEDLVACCDRIIALHEGQIAGEYSGAEITRSAVSYAIEGGRDEQ